MRIAILGTRGIPNHYGGFEQFAEHLSAGLQKRGHAVTVYSTSNHPYRQPELNGVKIVRRWNPEKQFGAFAQFIYDLLCIMHSRRSRFDIVYVLGYTSSSVWWWLLPKDAVIVTNMDGFEWQRTKYSQPVRRFLKYAEKLAVRHGGVLVADAAAISDYILEKFQKKAHYLPYGANVLEQFDSAVPMQFGLTPFGYGLLISRIEPENNIEMILDGVAESRLRAPFLVIGNAGNRFGTLLKKKYAAHPHIRFLPPLYDQYKLDQIRHFCKYYFHGHTVGGTNPSLLEAMACGAYVCAHHNLFNNSVLGVHGHYFSSPADVTALLDGDGDAAHRAHAVNSNRHKIATDYTWEKIVAKYDAFFGNLTSHGKRP